MENFGERPSVDSDETSLGRLVWVAFGDWETWPAVITSPDLVSRIWDSDDVTMPEDEPTLGNEMVMFLDRGEVSWFSTVSTQVEPWKNTPELLVSIVDRLKPFPELQHRVRHAASIGNQLRQGANRFSMRPDGLVKASRVCEKCEKPFSVKKFQLHKCPREQGEQAVGVNPKDRDNSNPKRAKLSDDVATASGDSHSANDQGRLSENELCGLAGEELESSNLAIMKESTQPRRPSYQPAGGEDTQCVVHEVNEEASATTDAQSTHCSVLSLDVKGRTILHLASANHKVSTGQFCRLIQQGAAVNHQDIGGDTALHFAALCTGMETKLEVLLDNPVCCANPNIRGRGGSTPLHLAVNNRSREKVCLLLNYGANPSIRDHNGSIPSELCSNDEIKHVLIEAQERVIEV